MPESPPVAGSQRSLSQAVLLGFALYAVVNCFDIVAPIILAFTLIILVSLALNPLVMRLRDWFGRRSVGMAILTMGFVLLVGGSAWGFYSPLTRSAGTLWARLPDYWQRLEQPLRQIERTLDGNVSVAPRTLNSPGQSQGGLHFDRSELVGSIAQALQTLISNTAASLLVILTVMFGVVFTLLNPQPVFAAFFKWIPQQHQSVACRIGWRLARFVPRWACTVALAMVAVGLLVFLSMWPIFGFQDALVLGLIATCFEAVPYIGAVLAGIPALLLALSQGGWTPLWVFLAYLSIQLLEHNLINPLIVAGRLRQHPVAVIFSVLISVALFGVLGVLIAVPMVAFAKILYEEIYRPRFLPGISEKQIDATTQFVLYSPSAASDPKPQNPVNKLQSLDD